MCLGYLRNSGGLFSINTHSCIFQTLVHAVQCSEECKDIYSGETKQPLNKRHSFTAGPLPHWRQLSDCSLPRWSQEGCVSVHCGMLLLNSFLWLSSGLPHLLCSCPSLLIFDALRDIFTVSINGGDEYCKQKPYFLVYMGTCLITLESVL